MPQALLGMTMNVSEGCCMRTLSLLRRDDGEEVACADWYMATGPSLCSDAAARLRCWDESNTRHVERSRHDDGDSGMMKALPNRIPDQPEHSTMPSICVQSRSLGRAGA